MSYTGWSEKNVSVPYTQRFYRQVIPLSIRAFVCSTWEYTKLDSGEHINRGDGGRKRFTDQLSKLKNSRHNLGCAECLKREKKKD